MQGAVSSGCVVCRQLKGSGVGQCREGGVICYPPLAPVRKVKIEDGINTLIVEAFINRGCPGEIRTRVHAEVDISPTAVNDVAGNCHFP